jgi:putative MATE family efflux protein
VVGVAIMLIVMTVRRPIISLLYGNIELEVMTGSARYFLITAASYPFLAIYSANAALFRATGNSKIPMRIALLVNVINVTGNAFFIFYLHIGVTGAAISTLTSRVVAALITIGLLTRDFSSPISLAGIRKVQFLPRVVRNILNVGVPSGLENSMFQIGRLLTQRIFTGFGTSAMAGNAIAGVINSFSFMPGMAYGMALLTIVGQCVGAGDYDAAKRNTAKILKLSYITLFILSALIYVFLEPLVSLFALSPEAHELAKSFLRVHCISMALGWTMSFALPNALRAAGDARYVMIAASVSMWTVRVSAAYLLSFTFGVGPLGVWLAMGGDFMVRGLCYYIRWVRGKWQQKRVLDD